MNQWVIHRANQRFMGTVVHLVNPVNCMFRVVHKADHNMGIARADLPVDTPCALPGESHRVGVQCTSSVDSIGCSLCICLYIVIQWVVHGFTWQYTRLELPSYLLQRFT